MLSTSGSRKPSTRCGMAPLLASLAAGTSATPLGRRGHWSAAVQTSKSVTARPLRQILQWRAANKPRINARIATTQRQDAFLSISRSKGNQMASQVAKPPYAPPPREPGFPPPARPPRPDRRSTANRIGLPIRRIREACGWDSAYCCQPMRQLLTNRSPPITNL